MLNTEGIENGSKRRSRAASQSRMNSFFGSRFTAANRISRTARIITAPDVLI